MVLFPCSPKHLGGPHECQYNARQIMLFWNFHWHLYVYQQEKMKTSPLSACQCYYCPFHGYFECVINHSVDIHKDNPLKWHQLIHRQANLILFKTVWCTAIWITAIKKVHSMRLLQWKHIYTGFFSLLHYIVSVCVTFIIFNTSHIRIWNWERMCFLNGSHA